MFFRKKCRLLPFIRKDIESLSADILQMYGWEIRSFDIPKYWNQTQGEDIIVAVIDTGCDLNHKDLKNNLLEGKNFVNKRKSPTDGNGHGTHVSGTIAAQNNDLGIVGVAPKCKILPIKSLDDNGSGNIRDIIDALIWATDQKVDFITMSLGSPNDTKDLQQAVKYATDNGSIVFCAAGNSGEDSEIMYPAKYTESISIGAIDERLERTSFTCSGEELDFLAPGHNILGCVPNDDYAVMSGTSMSNPFAVGCAALVASYRRKNKLSKLQTPNEYIEYFAKYSIKLRNKKFAGQRKYEGYGIITPYLSRS